MKGLLIILLFSIFLSPYIGINSFAQVPSPAQIQRSEELLEKEKALRERIEKEEKVLIKKIVVEGAVLLSKETLEEIIFPFQNFWLTKEDIQQILELIGQAYKQKGYTRQPSKISYQIKKNNLIIKVEE